MSRALVDYIHYNMANYWNNGQGNIEDPRKGALAISNLSQTNVLRQQQMDRQAKIESLKLGQTKEQRKEIEQLLKEVNEIANKDYFTKLLRTPSDQSFQQIGTQIKFKSTSDFNNVFNKVVMQSMTDYIGNIAKRFFADVIEPLNNSLTKKDGRKDFDINKDVQDEKIGKKWTNEQTKKFLQSLNLLSFALSKNWTQLSLEEQKKQIITIRGYIRSIIKNLPIIGKSSDAFLKIVDKALSDKKGITDKVERTIIKMQTIFRFNENTGVFPFLNTLFSNLKGQFGERYLEYVLNTAFTKAEGIVNNKLKSIQNSHNKDNNLITAKVTGKAQSGFTIKLSDVYTSFDYIDKKVWGGFKFSSKNLTSTSTVSCSETQNKSDVTLNIKWKANFPDTMIGFSVKAYKPSNIQTQTYKVTLQGSNNMATLLLGAVEGFPQHFLNLIAAHEKNSNKPVVDSSLLKEHTGEVEREVVSLLYYQGLAAGNILKAKAGNVQSHIIVLYKEKDDGSNNGIDFVYTKGILEQFQEAIETSNFKTERSAFVEQDLDTDAYLIKLMLTPKKFLGDFANNISSKANQFVIEDEKTKESRTLAIDERLTRVVNALRAANVGVEMEYTPHASKKK